MAKGQRTTKSAPESVSWNELQGRVHTFESFGRAIVAAALKQAEKNGGINKEAAATVTVTPIDVPTATLSGRVAGKAAGHGAEGQVVTTPAISIAICFGDECHFYTL
ncbi:MAG: hypothetical protein KF810_13440 [Rhizobiaceae bacterium]|nr:hypothetical protein [Rhizobiaceae bacterium]